MCLEIAEPKTVAEAVQLLDANDPTIRPISGGTALLQMMKSKIFQPTKLVSLRKIQDELTDVLVKDNGELRIGAMTSLRVLERSPVVHEFNPVITQAMKTLSNVRVRNVATVGGHIAHADPHMDLPPILLALGAKVVTFGKQGSRTIPLSDLFSGYYTTTLSAEELITELVIPKIDSGTLGSYLKCTALSADDWPMVGVAVFFRMQDGKIVNPRVSVSAATEKPMRLHEIESLVEDQTPADKIFEAAGLAAASAINPLPDIRGSVAYKKEMVNVYVRRAFEKALADGMSKGRRENA